MTVGKQSYISVSISTKYLLLCCVVLTNTTSDHNNSKLRVDIDNSGKLEDDMDNSGKLEDDMDNYTISLIEENSKEVTPNLPNWVNICNSMYNIRTK